MDLNHLKIKLLNDLPIECLESHSVSIVTQTEVLFFGDHIFKEFFLDSLALLFHLLLLLQLLGVLAFDKLKDGGLFMIILRRRIYSTRLRPCVIRLLQLILIKKRGLFNTFGKFCFQMSFFSFLFLVEEVVVPVEDASAKVQEDVERDEK